MAYLKRPVGNQLQQKRPCISYSPAQMTNDVGPSWQALAGAKELKPILILQRNEIGFTVRWRCDFVSQRDQIPGIHDINKAI